MGNTLKQGVKFLAALGYSEDQAMTMLTTACDFSVTQLVDGNCARRPAARRHTRHHQSIRCRPLMEPSHDGPTPAGY